MGDFGVSKLLGGSRELATTVVGSPGYLAPELCSGEPYDAKADIWSFGVSVSELCSLRHPFAGAASQAALVVRIMAAALPPPPRRYSAPLGRMLQACMQRQPAHRPSALQLLCVPTVLRHAAEQGIMHMLPAEAKVHAAAALAPPAPEPAAAAARDGRDGRDNARPAPGGLNSARERAANDEARRGARDAGGRDAGGREGGGRLSARGAGGGAAVVRQSSVPVLSARPRVQAAPFQAASFQAAAHPVQRAQSRPESPTAPTAPTARLQQRPASPTARVQRHVAEGGAPAEAAEGPVATRTRGGRGRTNSDLGNSVGFGPGVHFGNNPGAAMSWDLKPVCANAGKRSAAMRKSWCARTTTPTPPTSTHTHTHICTYTPKPCAARDHSLLRIRWPLAPPPEPRRVAASTPHCSGRDRSHLTATLEERPLDERPSSSPSTSCRYSSMTSPQRESPLRPEKLPHSSLIERPSSSPSTSRRASRHALLPHAEDSSGPAEGLAACGAVGAHGSHRMAALSGAERVERRLSLPSTPPLNRGARRSASFGAGVDELANQNPNSPRRGSLGRGVGSFPVPGGGRSDDSAHAAPAPPPAPPQTPPSLWQKRRGDTEEKSSNLPGHLQLLSLNAGGWEELQSPLDAFAEQHCPKMSNGADLDAADMGVPRRLLQPEGASPLSKLMKEFVRPGAMAAAPPPRADLHQARGVNLGAELFAYYP